MARPYRRGRFYNYPNLRTNPNNGNLEAQELHATGETAGNDAASVQDTARTQTSPSNNEAMDERPRNCRVRFFNAAAGYGDLDINVGGVGISDKLEFGEVTEYKTVPDGFQQVAITMVQNPQAVLLNKRFPFRNCMNTTAAIINTSTGIEIMLINDTGCRIDEVDRACFRVVNLSYTSPALDVILENGNPVFEDIRFKYVTEYKQVVPGEYNFNIMTARTAQTVKSNTVDIIMPEIPVDEGGYPGEVEDAYAYFYQDFEEGERYTAYIIGNKNYDPSLRVETLEEKDD